MKLFDKLTSRNFEMFAAHYYNNTEATDVEEFKEDAVALSVNGGNGVYYAKAYEAGAVDLVLSGG